jgi:hypothetical protein
MERNDRWLSTALRLAPLRRLARRLPWLAQQAPVLLTVGSIFLMVIPFAFIAARVVVSAQSFLAGGLVDIVGRLQTFATEHFAGLAERLNLPVESRRRGCGGA